MEKAAKDIQMENTAESEMQGAAKLCPPAEEEAEKPSMFCFKKRKKSGKKASDVKGTCEEESANLNQISQCSADHREGKASNPSQSPKGAWATIKCFVRPRRKLKSSSRKHVPSDSQVQLETSTEEAGLQSLPKKEIRSGLKIPCIRFSSGKRKPSLCEMTEESDNSIKGNEAMDILDKATSELEGLAIAVQSSPDQSSGQSAAKKESESTPEKSADSAGENELSREPRPLESTDQHTGCPIQSETMNSETVAVIVQEKQCPRSQPEMALHTVTKKDDGSAPFGAESPEDLPECVPRVTEVQSKNAMPEKQPGLDEFGISVSVSEDYKSKETLMGSNQSAFRDEAANVQSCSNEQFKLEENKDVDGVGIVITVTDADNCDEVEPSYICKLPLIPRQTKPKGSKKSGNFDFSSFSDCQQGSVAGSGHWREDKNSSHALSPKGLSDQGQRTSEQYELLLIETASSLVKAAIQSSIEQLVNEMALEHNKQNSFL
ncbi:PREDICTED: A-kinase anchor protein 5 [Crocodylus porosus]|uniref:A-kinase anchoring protein 5 n=1 Tax=Crocodylus porosus TaxID=8502 RepID=A0A7M4FCU2_CROPO|nr:PREDICTED: A-kinase anchor protein 5 [Crocodylus porosus]XP_019406383.1 PREDICTED: A-kinase anchor protein 5 [Crocodylus porosus]